MYKVQVANSAGPPMPEQWNLEYLEEGESSFPQGTLKHPKGCTRGLMTFLNLVFQSF